MKTKVWLPAAILAIGLSSFSKAEQQPASKTNTISIQTGEYCSIYAITSLTKNGEHVPFNPMQPLFYFCSDNNFSLYTDDYVANGTWIDNGKNLLISVSVPDPAMDWVDGSWTILERSEWVLEMEKVENGETWRVRLEGRQR